MMTAKSKEEDILKQGAELLLRNNYNGAIGRFNFLLSVGAGFTLSDDGRFRALDLRAATLIKLHDFPSALEDGRRMIKIKRGDPQGYLRTGTACEHLEKYDMAWSVYKLGLNNVLPTEPRFKLLKLKSERMIRKCQTCDPLQLLPLDLVEMVMKYLSFAQLTRLLRVSMMWCTILTGLPSLWTHLDLGYTKRPVPIATIRDYIRRSKNGLARASLYTCKSRHDEMLSDELLRCRTLKHLDINITGGVHDCTLLKSIPSLAGLQVLVLSGHVVLPFDRVMKLLDSCKTLTRAEFHRVEGPTERAEWMNNVSVIRSLAINGIKGPKLDVTSIPWTKLFERIPQVEHLRCSRWGFHGSATDFTVLKNLRDLDLTHSYLESFPRLPESIQVLDLCSCTFFPDAFRPTGQNPIYQNQLPNLKALLLASIYGLAGSGVKSLLSANKGNLVRLNLAHCARLEPEDIHSLIQDGYLKAVNMLSLAGCHFADETAYLLAEASPALEYLDIALTTISGIGVKALVRKPGRKLEKLKLDSCQFVTADTLRFARDSGIDVQFIMGGDPEWTRQRSKRVRPLFEAPRLIGF